MGTCPSCAQATDETQRYCPACGTTLDVEALPTGTAPRDLSPRPSPPPRASTGTPARTPTPTGPQPRFVPGTAFADRYRIVGLLGRGGMGEVYRADDLRLGQSVALKFLPESLKDDPARLERLFSEVRTARQVSHPALCRVYDAGEARSEER